MARLRTPSLVRPACLTVFALAACSIGARQGPPFDEAFPDPSVLVTTADPTAVRARLDDVQLPTTQAHHDRLLAMLRGLDRLSAAHLSLLTRAVATPDQIIVWNGTRVWRYGPRGTGKFAPVTEQLLTEGIDKISDIDAHWFGELIAVTQSDATLRLYADRFLARVDDGSTDALAAMLDGMIGSPAAIPFLAGYLAPKGGLDGERGWVAFAHMSFDSERTVVLDAVLARNPRIDGDRMVEVMKAFAFDSGREQAFAGLAAKVQPLPIASAKASLATFAFDSGRDAAFAALGTHEGVQLSDRHLVEFTRMCAFDSGKLHCVKALAPRLTGTPNGADAKALLVAFAFDSDREAAVRVLGERWAQLSSDDRHELLATFSFDSGRQAASRMLMR